MLEGWEEIADFWKHISSPRGQGENDPHSVLGDLKMKPNLTNPLTRLAFSREERQLYVKEGGTRVSVSFMGLGFRHLLCLAAGRLRIKLYMKYLSPLYHSLFNK